MDPLPVTDYTVTSALGSGLTQHLEKLRRGTTGLAPCTFAGISDLETWTGEVEGLDQVELPDELSRFDCRNNRLAWSALHQDAFRQAVGTAVGRYGSDRVGVFLGTSTSGIHQTELAYRELASDGESAARLPDWYCYEGTHNTYSVAELVRLTLGLRGLSSVISTACSSSAKVFASAHRAIEAGLCDAAVVGGVDSLCLTTLYGFHSLQLLANDICRPSDAERGGLSIGEAAGFALLQRVEVETGGVQLMGYGESSDAYHMSSPHPEGAGAIAAMQGALNRAGVVPEEIDYINLHGTGTLTNDLIESIAVEHLFARAVPCSSTKGFTGHTLGAAGIVEAVFAMLSLEHNFMPPSLNTRKLDPEIKANVLLHGREQEINTVLSNSFGFGGSNCSLVLGRMSA